jgi:hypothetical protein
MQATVLSVPFFFKKVCHGGYYPFFFACLDIIFLLAQGVYSVKKKKPKDDYAGFFILFFFPGEGNGEY